MIIFICCCSILLVFVAAGSLLYADHAWRESENLRANITALQNKLTLETRANTRLEIENARLIVEVKELRQVAVRQIDNELAAQAKAIAA